MTESIWFTDALMRIHVAPEDTDGAYALIEALAPSGHMPPPHIHERDGEGFFVLEGEVTLYSAAGERVLRPGQGAHLPAGEPHTFRVTSAEPARMLLISAPAGFADFVRAVGRPAESETLPGAGRPTRRRRVRRRGRAARHHVRRPAGRRSPPTSWSGPSPSRCHRGDVCFSDVPSGRWRDTRLNDRG